MAVSINITDSAVKIENVLKKSSFTLGLTAWESLVDCSKEVAKSITDRKSSNWILHPAENIRISTSIFNSAIYIHIREWKKDYPTTKGVSFYEKDWPELSAYFTADRNEIELAKKVMTTILRLETQGKMKEACDGCVNSYPSQKDHECLMNAAGLAHLVMDKIVIKPQDFILMMAQEAVNQGHVLENPHMAYKRVKSFKMDAIKDAIVEADYNF